MDDPKLNEIVNDYGFIEILDTETDEPDSDCFNPKIVKGMWDQRIGENYDLNS